MERSEQVPWQLKIAAKVILSRIPISHRLLNKAGIFNVGGMDNPKYAVGVFLRHFQNAVFARKDRSALRCPGTRSWPLGFFGDHCAQLFGASAAYAVDVSPLAAADVQHYRDLANYLRDTGYNPPSFDGCSDLDSVMKACNGQYLFNGVESLKSIPTASVDFIFSHTVLQHVRRKDFPSLLAEMRRIQRPDGVGSHTGFDLRHFGWESQRPALQRKNLGIESDGQLGVLHQPDPLCRVPENVRRSRLHPSGLPHRPLGPPADSPRKNGPPIRQTSRRRPTNLRLRRLSALTPPRTPPLPSFHKFRSLSPRGIWMPHPQVLEGAGLDQTKPIPIRLG